MTEHTPTSDRHQDSYWTAAAGHFLSLDADEQKDLLDRATDINRATLLATVRDISAAPGR
jgi:hypothetical protein